MAVGGADFAPTMDSRLADTAADSIATALGTAIAAGGGRMDTIPETTT